MEAVLYSVTAAMDRPRQTSAATAHTDRVVRAAALVARSRCTRLLSPRLILLPLVVLVACPLKVRPRTLGFVIPVAVALPVVAAQFGSPVSEPTPATPVLTLALLLVRARSLPQGLAMLTGSSVAATQRSGRSPLTCQLVVRPLAQMPGRQLSVRQTSTRRQPSSQSRFRSSTLRLAPLLSINWSNGSRTLLSQITPRTLGSVVVLVWVEMASL